MTSALALTLLLAAPGPPQGIAFGKNFDEAMEEARKVDKPVMVYVWAEWCGWCRRLDRSTFVDPVVTAKAQNFVPVKVNSEGSRREYEIVEEYAIHNIPTILFLSPRGRQVLRVNAFQGPGRFPYSMDEALEAARKVSAWEEALERDESDPVALASLGKHMLDQDCYEEAYDLLMKAAANDGRRPPVERRQTRFLLAILQNVQHQYAEAEVVIKEALNMDPQAPDQPKLLFVLGHTYVKWGRREQGVQTLEKVISEHPQSPVAQKARETLVQLQRK